MFGVVFGHGEESNFGFGWWERVGRVRIAAAAVVGGVKEVLGFDFFDAFLHEVDEFHDGEFGWVSEVDGGVDVGFVM